MNAATATTVSSASNAATRHRLVPAGIGVATATAGYFLIDIVSTSYDQGLIINGLLLGLVALAVGLLVSQLGLYTLGIGAFYGTGAYAFAVATITFGWGATAAAGFAFAVGTAAAGLIGLAVVRLPRMPFMMVTLALAAMGQQLVQLSQFRSVLGGEAGLVVTPSGTLLGIPAVNLVSPTGIWPIIWAVTVIGVAGVVAIRRSGFGSRLRGIRENEMRMRFCGFNTFRPRVLAFTVSGALATAAGVLECVYNGTANPDMLSLTFSGVAVIAALVGGVGYVVGPLLGGGFYSWIQSELTQSGNLDLYTGLAAAVVIVFLPDGIAGLLHAGAKRLGGLASRRTP